ncbi:unnamed protein product [Arctia plantaginis]|uniref:Uncharacterized protein n=1 Tax=Arctia plantaginis TaxID=874455 RepID=A0A8S0YRM6_ARCPL|nr:unnamed protein product [Arctia plantaginis]
MNIAEEYFSNNWVHMFMNELTSRIVADSGIPSDRFHLGKIILQGLRDDPEFVMQIDGATGQSETNGSVLRRSIQCATSLRNIGLKKDDVIVLMGPNHLDLAIPLYAGFYLGLAVAPTDRTMNIYELQQSFGITKPKVVFCQSEKVQDVQKAVKLLQIDTKVISFDKSSDTLDFAELLETYGGKVDVNNFKATDFKPEVTISLLIPTSGTTGLPKSAALTHKNMAIAAPYVWSFSTNFPSPTTSSLNVAPIQWLSTLLNFMLNPFMKYLRIQTSAPITSLNVIDLINKYKPTFFISSPTMLTTLLKTAEKSACDFSSFEYVYVGGSAVPLELIKQLKTLTPNTIVQDTYGMSEVGSLVFNCVGAPPGSCGKRYGHMLYRLVDVDTKEDIKEPNRPGELWLKGPSVFKGYYNNPETTDETFAEDGWLKTGDLLYRDENWNYYFVDRIKSLFKYGGYQISPVEIETVIRQHPGILDVAVIGILVSECNEIPVACVVLRSGFKTTANEIKELVKEKLSDRKRLRGGVIFLSELPLTPSTKIHRKKLKEMVMERISELDLQQD